MLAGLGLNDSPLVSSFGCSDADEITRRQAIMRFLSENKEVCREVQRLVSLSERFVLPKDGDVFLNIYGDGQNHPYWEHVQHLINTIRKVPSLPDEVELFVRTLEGTLALKESELEMAAMITERLRDVTVFQGYVEIPFEVGDNLRNIVVDNGQEIFRQYYKIEAQSVDDDWMKQFPLFGYQAFSAALGKLKTRERPTWLDDPKDWRNRLGFGKIVQNRIKRQHHRDRAAALNGMVVSTFTRDVYTDVVNAVSDRLHAIEHKVNHLAVQTEDVIDKTRLLNNSLVCVAFSYGEKGLSINIVGVKCDGRNRSEGSGFSFQNFDGYSERKMHALKDASRKVAVHVQDLRRSLNAADLAAHLKAFDPDFFDKSHAVKSPRTDLKYRWFAVSNMYVNPHVKTVYDALLDHRSFFTRNLTKLNNLVTLVDQMEVNAKKFNAPLCYPEISADGHLIEFEELWPLHLLMKAREEKSLKVVPIRGLPQINGQVVCLSGRHGGGKTVTTVTVPLNLYLAQSGLPTFGVGFRFNVKKVFGLCFVERGRPGDASLMQLLMKKLTELAVQVKGYKGSEVVLVLDEVGIGTQEDAGFELGRDFLRAMTKQKISVLLNTQIQALARFVESDLSGLCYKFDADHRITKGVGDGGMNDLRRESGFDQAISALN
jgi:hypothetical protein